MGLIAPHLVRPATDRSPSAVLLPSALAGAVLLTAADVLVRLLPTPTELKLGVVTAFIGVPVFAAMLLKARTPVVTLRLQDLHVTLGGRPVLRGMDAAR